MVLRSTDKPAEDATARLSMDSTMPTKLPLWSIQSGKTGSTLSFEAVSNPPHVEVLSKIPNRPQEDTSSPLQFFHLLERLKTEKREGWRRFHIDHGESIADHMYRMSILTMLAPPPLANKLNIPHCTKMALIHDMAESLVGDLTPMDGVPKAEKSRREAETMDYICKTLLGRVHGGLAGADIRAIWQEYEDSQTLESLFVHDIDKVELMLQMLEYERSHDGKTDLSEFSNVQKRLELPEMNEWAEELMQEREIFWKGKGGLPKQPGVVKASEVEQDEYYGVEK